VSFEFKRWVGQRADDPMFVAHGPMAEALAHNSELMTQDYTEPGSAALLSRRRAAI
jgi:hypothetical protein